MDVRHSARAAIAAAAVALAGCTWTSNMMGDRIDYKSAQTRSSGLEVPPDLSQLPPEERFSVPERPTTATASHIIRTRITMNVLSWSSRRARRSAGGRSTRPGASTLKTCEGDGLGVGG